MQEVNGLLRLEYHIEEVKEDYTCRIEIKVSHNGNEEEVEISVTEGSENIMKMNQVTNYLSVQEKLLQFMIKTIKMNLSECVMRWNLMI